MQKHYASEHFKFSETTRDLRTEQMRLAGTAADGDVLLQRYRSLQERIEALKTRLRNYESVEDAYFDSAPIVVDS